MVALSGQGIAGHCLATTLRLLAGSSRSADRLEMQARRCIRRRHAQPFRHGPTTALIAADGQTPLAGLQVASHQAGIERLDQIVHLEAKLEELDSLDRDDTDYQGPETITLALDDAARYAYFVDNYVAGNGSRIGPSRPTVSVRIGQALREFSLPPGEAGTQKFWKVFEIIDGAVVPCAAGCLVDLVP